MENIVAINLTRARQFRGLTMDQLAGKINCSKQAISHYENGVRYPDSKTLLAIGDALDLELDYFYSDSSVKFSLHNISYRQGFGLDSKQKQDVEDETSSLLSDYLELEAIAKELVVFQNPLEDLVISSTSDAEKAAKQLRKRWKLGEGPISNITGLLERKGVRIIKCDFDFFYTHEGLSGWAEDKKVPVIVLNSRQQDLSRMRFTILHELGHLLLVMAENVDEIAIERICDAFAGAVLLPVEILIQEFGKNRTAITMPELKRIKELYGISVAAIMVRASVTKLISWDAYNKWKQSDFSDFDYGQFSGTEEPQRFEQMLYRCLSERKIGFDKAARLARRDEAELRKIYSQQQLEF
ncbi:helix-turn-helix domain-containing protein [Pontibacter mangrovi]|nr:XRE family transcriptional regulator [Pontibacter mangrovi]